MKPVRRIVSRTVVLPLDNVDTDQIIPARFLSGTSRRGLGAGLFSDWRRQRRDFPLNRKSAAGARILVAGANFGCGSSREHAAWALRDAGFRAVLGRSFADIFRGNAVRNGLVPVELDADPHRRIAGRPDAEITVDVERETVSVPGGGTARFRLAPFARRCLLSGAGPLDFLLSHEPGIARYEELCRRAGNGGDSAEGG